MSEGPSSWPDTSYTRAIKKTITAENFCCECLFGDSVLTKVEYKGILLFDWEECIQGDQIFYECPIHGRITNVQAITGRESAEIELEEYNKYRKL